MNDEQNPYGRHYNNGSHESQNGHGNSHSHQSFQTVYPPSSVPMQKTDEEVEEAPQKKPIPGAVFWAFAKLILAIIAIVVVGYGCWMGISFCSEHISNLIASYCRKFERVSFDPYDTQGFGAFVQIIMTAIVVGWSARRFINMSKRKNKWEDKR